ncbi:MAG: hypothetical protein MUF45_15225 [Spirosomaceae bacterium]|nr:hypothetical protein [Spirosomataceae bacterium]
MENTTILSKPVKKNYKKHIVKETVTILHFPNNKIKPIIIDGKNTYPLYVRISLKGQVTTIKSLLRGTYDIEFSKENLQNDTISTMEFEKKIIRDYINKINPFGRDNFHISEISTFSNNIYKPIEFMHNEMLINWVVNFLEKYAEDNNVDKELFMSVINLNKDNVYQVIRAFKNFVPSIDALNSRPNHILEFLLSILSFDTMLYEKIITDRYFDKESFKRFNSHFFEDFKPIENNL